MFCAWNDNYITTFCDSRSWGNVGEVFGSVNTARVRQRVVKLSPALQEGTFEEFIDFFFALSQICEKRLVASLSLSVRPHGTTGRILIKIREE